jgi:drug/metabolite transporter (DMT)-like permease
MTTDHQQPISLRDWIIGIVCVLTAQILFGTTFAFNKLVINQGVDPILLGFNRSWIAILCLFPFYWTQRKKNHWTRSDWRLVFFVGAFATASAMILEYKATEYTSASNVSLIISTESILTLILCVVILKEKLRTPILYGGIGSAIGTVLVMWNDVVQFEIHSGTNLKGDLLVMMSVFCWSAYTINSKRILYHSIPIIAHFYITVFSCLTLGLVCLFWGLLPEIFSMDATAWGRTFYLGSICSGLAMLLYFYALKKLPASLVCLTLTLLPVFGVTFSVLLADETITIYQGIGGAAIIVSIGYAMWPERSQKIISETLPPGE